MLLFLFFVFCLSYFIEHQRERGIIALKDLKMSNGFASNIARYINLKSQKIFKLKSHIICDATIANSRSISD